MQTVCANSNLHYSLFCISSSAFAIICLYCSFTLSGASICTLPFPPKGYCFILIWYYTMNNLFFSRYEDSFATSIRQGVTVHSVHSNALRDAQKSCKAWFRAAILGFSVNFVHKKRLAERYQWTVTSRCHFLITPDTTFLRIKKREAEAPQLWIADTAW